MRLLQRESAEGGGLTGGAKRKPMPKKRGLVGGCCQMCQGSGLVGGRIVGLQKARPELKKVAQREVFERDAIREAKDEEAYKMLKTKKAQALFVNMAKYAKAGLSYPPPRKLSARQIARAIEREQNPTPAMLLKEWRDAVEANPECQQPQCQRMTKREVEADRGRRLKSLLDQYYEEEKE